MVDKWCEEALTFWGKQHEGEKANMRRKESYESNYYCHSINNMDWSRVRSTHKKAGLICKFVQVYNNQKIESPIKLKSNVKDKWLFVLVAANCSLVYKWYKQTFYRVGGENLIKRKKEKEKE